MEKLSLSSDAQSTVKNGTLIYTYDFRSETKKHQIKCIGCLDQRAEAPHISNSSSFCIARLFVVSCGIVETKLMEEFAFFFDRSQIRDDVCSYTLWSLRAWMIPVLGRLLMFVMFEHRTK